MLTRLVGRIGTRSTLHSLKRFSTPTEGSSSGSAEIWDWVPPATAKIQPLNDLKNYVIPVVPG